MSFFLGRGRKNKHERTPPSPIDMQPEPTTNGPVVILNDCNPIGMSYWRNINNHSNSQFLKVAISVKNEIHILLISKNTLQVIQDRNLEISHTGEGIYFSASAPEALYIPSEHQLIRLNISTLEKEVILEGHYKQYHSSWDDTKHSASVLNDNGEIIGWQVNDKFFERKGNPDECQIDKSGRYLIIKEDDSNRILDITTNWEEFISNQDGAVGHSDTGFEIVYGEDDFNSLPGALVEWNLSNLEKITRYSTGIWNMGYVSYSPKGLLVSTPSDLRWLDLSGNLIRTIETHSDTSDYHARVKANVCPLGEFAVWTEMNNGIFNAYLVRL